MIREDQHRLNRFLESTHRKAVDLWSDKIFHRLSSEDLAVPNKFVGFVKAGQRLPEKVSDLRRAINFVLTYLERAELNLVGIKVLQRSGSSDTAEVQLLLADQTGSKYVLKISSANSSSFNYMLLPLADFIGRTPLSDTLTDKPSPVRARPDSSDSLTALFATLDALRRQ
ncbi:hypothetical protein HYT84_02505 [Candidatus Micrarchaeota archaeon]|nr:hypothetical protein [Candidatus Micrarchaeota archaeon]